LYFCEDTRKKIAFDDPEDAVFFLVDQLVQLGQKVGISDSEFLLLVVKQMPMGAYEFLIVIF